MHVDHWNAAIQIQWQFSSNHWLMVVGRQQGCNIMRILHPHSCTTNKSKANKPTDSYTESSTLHYYLPCTKGARQKSTCITTDL